MTVQRVLQVVAIVAVVVAVAAGFSVIGSPSRARAIALDADRVSGLIEIAERVRDRGGPLPVSLGAGADAPRDPVTRSPYVYAKESATRYRLCATFATAGDADEPNPRWFHPAGPACFRLARGDVTPIGTAFRPPAPGMR